MRARLPLVLTALLVAGFAPAALAQKPGGLGGTYSVRGTNPGGEGGYTGTLQIEPTGDTYRFAWETGTASTGVGVRRGDAVAVAYGGDGCGVALYAPGANGTLVGTWATPGSSQRGTEIAAPAAGAAAGVFTVMGTNPGGGDPYRGQLTLRATGPTFTMRWEVAESTYEGTGVRLGDAFGVAYGATSCGVALYEIAPDGSLQGAWAMQGATDVGTEAATPR